MDRRNVEISNDGTPDRPAIGIPSDDPIVKAFGLPVNVDPECVNMAALDVIGPKELDALEKISYSELLSRCLKIASVDPSINREIDKIEAELELRVPALRASDFTLQDGEIDGGTSYLALDGRAEVISYQAGEGFTVYLPYLREIDGPDKVYLWTDDKTSSLEEGAASVRNRIISKLAILKALEGEQALINVGAVETHVEFMKSVTYNTEAIDAHIQYLASSFKDQRASGAVNLEAVREYDKCLNQIYLYVLAAPHPVTPREVAEIFNFTEEMAMDLTDDMHDLGLISTKRKAQDVVGIEGEDGPEDRLDVEYAAHGLIQRKFGDCVDVREKLLRYHKYIAETATKIVDYFADLKPHKKWETLNAIGETDSAAFSSSLLAILEAAKLDEVPYPFKPVGPVTSFDEADFQLDDSMAPEAMQAILAGIKDALESGRDCELMTVVTVFPTK